MDTNQDLFSLQIEPITKNHLSDIAKWGKFLAICGFIGCVLLIVMGVALPSMIVAAQEETGYSTNASALAPMLAFTYIIMAVIFFFPYLMLYRFSTRMKSALHSGSQETLNSSFDALKSLFKFVGIVTIILLFMMALSVLMGIMGSALGS